MQKKALLVLVAIVLVLTALGGVIGGVATALAVAEEAQAKTGEGPPSEELVSGGASPERSASVPERNGELGGELDVEAVSSVPQVAQPEADASESFVRHGVTESPAKAAGTIRLAAYNVENLFDDIDDPALSGRQEDIDDTKPEAHVLALAETIRRLDADILALQEIESEEVIRAFRDEHLADMGYDHLASIDAGDARGIEQSVLSRFPITGVTNWPGRELGGTHPPDWGNSENWYAGEPITFHRSPLRVTVEVPGDVTGSAPYELTVYTVHAKSGRPGEYWRLAEARGLVHLITEGAAFGAGSAPGENIAILGDFNAFASDESVQAYVGAGFTDVLGEAGGTSARFATHTSGRRIDHILVNDNLARELDLDTVFVLGTPALPEGVDWRQSWRPEGYVSDHYPVAVDLTPRDE